jgi:hypothetical protein
VEDSLPRRILGSESVPAQWGEKRKRHASCVKCPIKKNRQLLPKIEPVKLLTAESLLGTKSSKWHCDAECWRSQIRVSCVWYSTHPPTPVPTHCRTCTLYIEHAAEMRNMKNSAIYGASFISETTNYERFGFKRGPSDIKITICSIKKSKTFFHCFLAREQKNSGKKLFFFYLTWSFVLWNNFFRVRARTLSANHATTETADWVDAQANW